MKKFILTKNGQVVNMVIAEQPFIDTISSNYDLVVDASEHPGVSIGWTWSTETGFKSPTVPVIETAELPKKITQLAFISRFTDAEAIALDLASIGATVEAASIRRYMQKVNAATFIDLDREDTITGANQLEAVGLIGPGRAAVILTAPITEQEIAR